MANMDENLRHELLSSEEYVASDAAAVFKRFSWSVESSTGWRAGCCGSSWSVGLTACKYSPKNTSVAVVDVRRHSSRPWVLFTRHKRSSELDRAMLLGAGFSKKPPHADLMRKHHYFKTDYAADGFHEAFSESHRALADAVLSVLSRALDTRVPKTPCAVYPVIVSSGQLYAARFEEGGPAVSPARHIQLVVPSPFKQHKGLLAVDVVRSDYVTDFVKLLEEDHLLFQKKR